MAEADVVFDRLLAATGAALGLPIRRASAADGAVTCMVVGLESHRAPLVQDVPTADGLLLACRYGAGTGDVLLAGPLGDADVTTQQREVLAALAEALQTRAAEHATQQETQQHLRVVDRAMRSISSQLELDVVLRRIVEMARDLVDAQYAALGVFGPSGRLQAFITDGMSADVEAQIPHRPHGLGLLGHLLHFPETLRLSDLREHPDSIGMPAHHPPMHSFLGVPIPGRQKQVGNLYLTEKRSAAEFTEGDARVVELLARHAAVAIDNARLYQQLDQEQARLQHIIDWLPEAVLVIERLPADEAGHEDELITIANQQAIDLLDLRMRLPVPAEQLFSDTTRYNPDGSVMRTDSIPVMESLHEGVTHIQRQVHLVRRDGTRLTILVNSAPLRDSYGAISGAIAVFQDITMIRNAEQLKDDFLSLVSHELRTPLTAIQGGALLLASSASLDADTRRELLDDIVGESQRLTTLIENMVNIAHIRSGRISMVTEPTLLLQVVQRSVAAMRAEHVQQAASGGVVPHRFAVTIPPDLQVMADDDRLEQIVRNLLQNAVKYAPHAPLVEIEAEVAALRDDGGADAMAEAIISVRDHGPGIDPEDVPFVFERFRRSRAATSGGRPGLGLGLYLARHLVEAHGGRIWIEQPQDGGTRVRFSLPALVDSDADLTLAE